MTDDTHHHPDAARTGSRRHIRRLTADAERLLDELLTRCTFGPTRDRPAVVALSGGPDSSALAALVAHAGIDAVAVHVHHGLRPSADDDALTAERVASRLGLAFECRRVTVDPGPNLAARARDARLRALGDDAMTGHTADDQAETVLLALLRGSGATGLAGMRPGPTHPILALRRADTSAVCSALALEPAHDPTNDSDRLRRNRIRHEVVPLLADISDRDPTPLLARAADLLRDDDDLLDELAADLDPTDAKALAAAPPALARRAVRRWLRHEGYPPDAAAVERVLAVARGDAAGTDVGAGRRVERSRQRLVAFPPSSDTE